MKISYISKHGKNKNESQDCILVNDEVINNYAGTMDIPLKRLCIADGVGGVSGGYEASSFVLNHFVEDKSYKSGEELMKHLIKINDDLIEYASTIDGKKNMATTFTGLARIDKSIWLMHAGNTRLYSYKNGALTQITTDHTNYQAMVVEGGLTMGPKWSTGTGFADHFCKPDISDATESGSYGKSEDIDYLGKNVIYCCFGTGRRQYLNSMIVEELTFDEIPEILLFTSDGIHDHLTNEDMKKIISENLDDRNKLLALLNGAISNDSEDDCTAVIARISE